LNTRWQTSSNLSERVDNSNMRMFVAMDTQFTGAKLHKRSQSNKVTIHTMQSHNFASTVQSTLNYILNLMLQFVCRWLFTLQTNNDWCIWLIWWLWSSIDWLINQIDCLVDWLMTTWKYGPIKTFNVRKQASVRNFK